MGFLDFLRSLLIKVEKPAPEPLFVPASGFDKQEKINKKKNLDKLCQAMAGKAEIVKASRKKLKK